LFSLLHGPAAHRELHSFPTRRSSDLATVARPKVGTQDVHRTRGHFDTSSRFMRQFDHELFHQHRDVLAAIAQRREDIPVLVEQLDRKSTRLNSSHVEISYAVFCLKKK